MDKFFNSLIGKPYKPNVYSGEAFDCYSLIYYIYKHYGILLSKHIVKHDIRILSRKIKQDIPLWYEVDYSVRKFLDILLFNRSKRVQIHIALVINSKFFIHAVDNDSVMLGKFKSSPYIAKLYKVYRWHTL